MWKVHGSHTHTNTHHPTLTSRIDERAISRQRTHNRPHRDRSHRTHRRATAESGGSAAASCYIIIIDGQRRRRRRLESGGAVHANGGAFKTSFLYARKPPPAVNSLCKRAWDGDGDGGRTDRRPPVCKCSMV